MSRDHRGRHPGHGLVAEEGLDVGERLRRLAELVDVLSSATPSGRGTREFGIRLAFGALQGGILRLVVVQGLRLVAVGVVAGLAVAAAAGGLLSGLLYGVSAADPLTFLVGALLLTAVALVACYLPARRATRVDPVVALRPE